MREIYLRDTGTLSLFFPQTWKFHMHEWVLQISYPSWLSSSWCLQVKERCLLFVRGMSEMLTMGGFFWKLVTLLLSIWRLEVRGHVPVTYNNDWCCSSGILALHLPEFSCLEGNTMERLEDSMYIWSCRLQSTEGLSPRFPSPYTNLACIQVECRWVNINMPKRYFCIGKDNCNKQTKLQQVC